MDKQPFTSRPDDTADNAEARTFKDLVRYGVRRFKAGGVTEPVTSARILVSHLLGWDMATVIRCANLPLAAAVLSDLEPLLARRLAHEPLQYITGEAPFYDQNYLCNPSVLVPRPETELLVHEALKYAKENGEERLRIIDVGTGSGVIAITFKLHIPNCEVFATDIATDALEIARHNARKLNVGVNFILGNLFEGLTGEFDIIISNPPYIKSDKLRHLQPEIAYEPTIALDGGRDGMAVLTPLIRQMSMFLRNQRGLALIEIDPPISGAATSLARELFPQAHVEVQKDFNNLDRILRIITL